MLRSIFLILRPAALTAALLALASAPAPARPAFPAGDLAVAAGDSTGKPDVPDHDLPHPYDAGFLFQVAATGMAEVAFSELVQTRASEEGVKKFAHRIVKDHGLINDTTSLAASALKRAQPSRLDRDALLTADRLSSLKGAEFDRAYIKQVVEDHKKAVKLFEAEVKDGNNDNLKAFAADTLPELQEHLKQARALNEKLNGK